ncbi:hypothetical protein L5515_005680 [Caenorhabditis briggsae]|uniref:Uncharacterized protein n=1 Tax=Caenorhabditis briggsae TaxID=6238 RepID=A0AAE9JJV3_CAEBR|nr:hypothetical protein L5515_005680 [Caenorhabditis briggsae]
MFDPITIFFLTFHTFAAVLGLTFNGIVLFLALFRTPKTIAAYTTILINFAVTDFLACFTDFFIQMRHIPAGFTMAYMSRGLCTLWVFLLADDDAVEIKRILMERFQEYELENATVCGTINVIEFPAMYTILHMTVPITPVYITIWMLRKKIIAKLVSNSKDMSAKTKEMHKQLLKALTWQALIPGFYGMSVFSYVIAQFFYSHPVFEYTTLTGFLFMPVLSPLACLIFIQIYKKRVLSWWYLLIGKPIPQEWLTILASTKTGATSGAPASVAPSSEAKSKH